MVFQGPAKWLLVVTRIISSTKGRREPPAPLSPKLQPSNTTHSIILLLLALNNEHLALTPQLSGL